MAVGQLDVARVFARDRWLPHDPRRAGRALRRFLAEDLVLSDFYRPYAGLPLAEIPVVDKRTVLAEFAAFNRHRITLDQALAVAEGAERSRDFGARVGGVTVGLSTGTSGTRGVFLVSDAERRLWAGTLMAQLLAPEALRLMARRPLRVALFLRANSNLYETLDSRRVAFAWHDLTVPLEQQLPALRGTDVVVAPASVLRAIAEAAVPGLEPTQVVSVAETLEPDDEAVIAAAFGRRVDQIYQATEGLLAVSCPAGRLHLNERYVHVEPEWLDHRRFHPVVTDFARTTQFVVRHRLDDVLLAAPGPCPCGRPGRTVAAVLGRADDVLELAGEAGPVRVYPDALRHAVALAGQVEDHRIRQTGREWQVAVRAREPEAALDRIADEVARLARRLGAEPPRVVAAPWPDEAPDQKRRRIRRTS
ncbi:F390 synthetase-related protein [Nocardioides panacisoli]|uniref:Adenylate synthase n=1 Tax=Nocardioides panacisoli TaxID=627624 RepID=A0ABP7IAY0_9ACTN